MAHPRKRNEAEDRKRLRRTLKRLQLRKARMEAEKARKEGRDEWGREAMNEQAMEIPDSCRCPRC